MLRFASSLLLLFCLSHAICNASQAADRLERARALWENGRFALARDEFVAVGAAAIPFLAETYRTTDRSEGHKQVLMGFLGAIDSDGAEIEFVRLLSDSDPVVRGTAIIIVGQRRYAAAIPDLIRLLNDTSVFLTVISSHQPDVDILIRDKAIDALNSVTGQTLLPKASKKRQVAAWQSWWESWDGTIPNERD